MAVLLLGEECVDWGYPDFQVKDAHYSLLDSQVKIRIWYDIKCSPGLG